jgi:uncharacterized protein YjbI with pentapeptide repeats
MVYLETANLSGAVLTDGSVKGDHLSKAASLKGATLPD